MHKKEVLLNGSGREELFAGCILGAVAATEVAIGVAVCPVCIIGAPFFFGLGAFKKIKNKPQPQ